MAAKDTGYHTMTSVAPAELKEALTELLVSDVKLTGKQLGAGAYCSVEEAMIAGTKVTAMKLHPQFINLDSPQQIHKWTRNFVEQCELMHKLRHPHIVQFLGVSYPFPGSPFPVLLMEKLQTSLDSHLKTSPNIPLSQKASILLDICKGMYYLHSQDPPVAHCNLTAKSILIDSSGMAKIADLGLAKMVDIQPRTLATMTTDATDYNLYMPPEAVEDDGTKRYDTAIDVFSLGVISLDLFTLTQTSPKDLKPPTYHDPITKELCTRSEVERRDIDVQKIKTALGEAHSLVEITLTCLSNESQLRPTLREILERVQTLIDQLPAEKQPEEKKSSWWKFALGGAAIVGGAAAVVAAPVVVGALGFGAGGIAAGSIAASMMSAMGPVAAGGVVATLQSVGAAGLGAAGTTVVAAAGATVGAGVAGAAGMAATKKKKD